MVTLMYEVAEIDPCSDPRWDVFVANHPLGWICHLSGWQRVLASAFHHVKGHYFALVDKETNAIEAGMPVYEVRSWLTGSRLVSIPFATLCDPLVASSEEFETLLEPVLALSREIGASYVRLVSHRAAPLMADRGLGRAEYFKHHSLDLDAGPEALRKRFHRTCVRNRISKALKSDLNLRSSLEDADFDVFLRLHAQTRKRLGLPLQNSAYFRAIRDVFSSAGQVSVLLAEKDREALAAMLFLKFKDRVSVDVVAWDHDRRDVCPTHFLFWEGIKLACAENYRVFDFGRTGVNQPSLMEFKGRWGTQVSDLTDFYYPEKAAEEHGAPASSLRYRIVHATCRRAPDWVLPHIGRFCYRHLG